MLILALGDVVGKPGRRAVQKVLPGLREEHSIELVIANGENVAGGLGVTSTTAEELFEAGVDVLTSGNHIWAQKEILPFLDSDMPLLRPLNYPPGLPGRGYLVKNGVMVVNVMGRTFMNCLDCPFRTMDKLLLEQKTRPPIVFVDFHAEATSEKMALGRYLDGRVSAVLGTHTHVGTIDSRLLPKGTAYVTDIGMTGPIDSVIGDDVDSVIHHFMTMTPHRISVASGNRAMFNAILVKADEVTGKALSIDRIQQEVE